MCLAFLHYYPAQKIASCLSLPSYEKLFTLLRISNVRLEPKDGYEYMVSNNGKNQTLVDYLDELDWSHFDIEGLQRLLRYDPHNELCRANDDNLILIIPARQNLFVNVGHCSSECTATAIPPGGIHIFSGFLHSHLIECYYNSSNRKSVTVGGFGTQEEMCLAFLHYYPAQKIASCLSLPSYEKLFALLRISNVRLEPKDGYEYMVSNNGKNQTLVDYLDELDWSHFDIEGLQRLLRYDPHNELCRANDDNLILTAQDHGTILRLLRTLVS
ncbi:unnamed protein product [Darwinula stevensoni]|uniref:Copper type II ascorbate-dependent monooxygenase C-terminal domain-containing protein n=1 Tax=Darwinula stevensoni TaxID=69355 RepID=A0A7R9AHD2_9CRUS|nr:unnamed protein product [Darwinula stevensoni]CAG0905562.1 unnamed protein product [Darwinula stevensoni]